MNKNYQDITGQKFNRLTVLKRAGSDKQHHAKWLCRCDCGRETMVVTHDLKSGHTKSCGCLFIETSIGKLNTEARGESHPRYKHGGAKTRLYHVWCDMKRRCYDPHCDHYYAYGARGITVCDEWKDDFAAFRDWATENGFQLDSNGREQSIDRVDVSKGYSPDNCRWITYSENVTLRNLDYWSKRKLIRGEGCQE